MTQRAIPQYGRIAVGQRVAFRRLVAAPTPQPSAEQWARGGELVTIRTHHLVVGIRPCDSGAAVTLRHADGRGEIVVCFDAWGGHWGGFGELEVIEEAPEQRALPGMGRRAA